MGQGGECLTCKDEYREGEIIDARTYNFASWDPCLYLEVTCEYSFIFICKR